MCFRIPGRIVAIGGEGGNLGRVDVDGSEREVSLAMVTEDGVEEGDWVLIHMGVAVEVIDADRAAEVHEGLQLVGRAQQEALEDLEASWMARGRPDDEEATRDGAPPDRAPPDGTPPDGPEHDDQDRP